MTNERYSASTRADDSQHADEATSGLSDSDMSFEVDNIHDGQAFSFDSEYTRLPSPEVFNAYPPEVQRKILEWMDRDVKALREDESRRRDELMHARLSRDSLRTTVPIAIIILGIVCAAVTGLFTKNPVFVIAFLVIPFLLIVFMFVNNFSSRGREEDEFYDDPYMS